MTFMPVNDYKCLLCGERVVDSEVDLTGEPCPNPCEGALCRIYAYYLKPVRGGGGSPGRSVGGQR